VSSYTEGFWDVFRSKRDRMEGCELNTMA